MYKPTILIVDDIKENRLAIKIALKKENYNLHEAIDGVEALQKCIELNPDVILMDAIMPNLDGYEATKKIRDIEEFNRIPILMVTALNEKSDKIKALEYGVSDFISKPFDKHELIARCKSYVGFSHINKQYIHASKNPDTNLPNKSALLSTIKKATNPKVILFRIEDYELLEEFYTEDVAREIEKVFSKQIFSFVNSDCKSALLFHIREGEFALFKDDLEDKITPKKAQEYCEELYKKTKDSLIIFDEYDYDINIILSYAHGKENLFEHARVGLNHAIKEKESIVFANDIIEKVQKDAINNIEIIKMIKEALSDNKVVSYFQPLLNNKTNEIEKYESLVRIIDKDNQCISPFFFLDIAKKGKYYTQITQRVLENSLEALQTTNKEISINISATDIENDLIRNLILSSFERNPEIGSRVVFELLEDENVKDFNTIVEFIKNVKSYGVKIAIDDFGSGYSNFERVLKLQPDIIKIDGSLIKNLDKDKFSRDIVDTIQGFAIKIGVKTVAEFVHSQKILDIVNEIGIDYTQGYHISPPVEKI